MGSTAPNHRHNAMNVSELVLMLADGAMLGSQLSSKVVASMFQHVCTLSQGDESELELSFEEFDTLLAWLCDRTLTDEERKKVEQEPGEFEDKFASWLGASFIPKFTKLMSQKRRGVLKSVLL